MTGLIARGMSVAFGELRVLDDVDLTVERGEIVGLIGPNGAGKTTFIDAVTGFVPSSGRVSLDGVDLSHVAPHRRVREGLVRTFQSGGLFPELSIVENLTVVSRGRGESDARSAHEVLEELGLLEIRDQTPTDLSHGLQRIAGLARAVFQRPKVLLLDEPAAGLDVTETRALLEPIRRLAGRGMGILLIDHDIDFVAQICSSVIAISFGRTIAYGQPQDVLDDPAVREAYLGDLVATP